MEMAQFKKIVLALSCSIAAASTVGCLAAAAGAGAGAEAAYIGTQEGRTAGETIDDQRITASIKTKLIADSQTAARNINVDTFKGTVTLRGYVRSAEERIRAVELAQSVSGVRQVESRLTLQ